jgi:class 3 adenylate cyclase
MAAPPRILVVDDTPHNRKLLADVLEVKGYAVSTAATGAEALARLARERPDLVLLDVVMPEMSGYEVCEEIRRDPETRLLPVVMVTALDSSEERVKSIEAGADDFLSKPINTEELLARVRSLLRIKELHDTVRDQAAQLAEWNTMLEQRVGEQVAELERLGRLKRFLPPQLAALIAEGGMDVLEPHRRRIVVAFVDLRGFTAFAESAEPEEVMDVLGRYHAVMGRLVMEHEGTLERFTGDGLVIVFNDPVELPKAEERAVRMAVAMRAAAVELREEWRRLGHDMDVGIGMTQGYATLGMIGFEGRRDYAAIGSVMNQAARLCAAADGGQILVSERLLSTVEALVEAEPVGELTLRGFRRPVMTHSLLRLRA